ncbi:putative helicase magatama 3 [Quercus suber]|uniref:Helicase magatama 3 n=1 Tax=Quercus suber TaxID=58331 RepID=A0AAW0KSL6_QUESU
MSKLATRRELLERWRGIEEDEDDDCDHDHDPSQVRRLHQLKEQWFADAFNFLICLPKETHIWCGTGDLMGPLLETFYNYFKDERPNSPLKLLWKRISEETRQCIQCVSQQHQALEMYNEQYELSSVGPLLDVLRSLNEERVTQHLREITARIAREEYDPARDNAEVISVMYEVLMFPVLLDDQSLFTEFETFIEAIDNKHELALDGQQQFPGVYALFFFKRRVRSVGHRLAGSMGKLSLVPKDESNRIGTFAAFAKEIYRLFGERSFAINSGTSRSRVKLDRVSIWLGIKSLLGFLEPPAFEEGILERYPIFLDLVLNHISSDSIEFSHAVTCLRLLFEMLGCKLWLRSTLSASVMRNTLLGQCFHTRNEKSHKDIFDLFQPFLQARGGPSLVSSLKDSSLHSSLRQPAFDLIQTIIVSDASALITSVLNSCTPWSIDRSMYNDLNDAEPFVPDVEEEDNSSWSEFGAQSKISSREFREWMCIPMLWIDVLVEIDPSVFPISFSKAVFWARSRFPMVEPESSEEMALPVRTWLSSSATVISNSFGWKIPTGSDDGGEGKESKNSVKVSSMCLPLVRTFNRLTAHFVVLVGQGELRKQWTWEPRMGESLILSLIDPNDVLLDCVLVKFQSLQHFFFVLCKLLKEGDLSALDMPENSSDRSNIARFSSQGGFLWQPVFDSLPVNVNEHSSDVDSKSREKFIYLLSETAWPPIKRCLLEGKAFIDHSFCQMTCVRLLEILPVIFEIICPSFGKKLGDSRMLVESLYDFSWLNYLMDWGNSSLKVIIVYWKRTVTTLLTFLRGSRSDTATMTIKAIENLISRDNFATDELTEQVSRLSVSLSKEASCNIENTAFRSTSLFPETLSFEKKSLVSDVEPLSVDDSDVEILDSLTGSYKKDKENLVVLSDSETEESISPNEAILSDTETGHCILDGKPLVPGSAPHSDPKKEKVAGTGASMDLLESFQQKDATDRLVASKSKDIDELKGKPAPASLLKSKGVDNKKKTEYPKHNENNSVLSQNRINLKNTDEAVSSNKMVLNCNRIISKTSDTVLKEIVRDSEDDPFELALKSARIQQSVLSKSTSLPKRQVIQLKSPFESRFGRLHRLEAGVKRFKPPRLDDWYRPILELDYFATVGLASASEDGTRTVSKLKEVPVCFQSPEQYMEIFRPLVLEEFKAQLNSSFLEMSSWEEMYVGSLSVMSVERVDDFHLVRFIYDDNDSAASRTFSENDLVLLTKEPLQKSSHDIHMIGKVERRERDNKRRLTILVIRFYLQNGSSRSNKARKNLIDRSKWHACRVMSITPQLREFQALSSINGIPIFPVILNPVNDSLGNHVSKEVNLGKLAQPLQQILKSSFNDSQLQAISVAVGSPKLKKDFELSLIQGPPGTGKTRTILAIVSGLLASPLQRTGNAKNSLGDSLKTHSKPFWSRPKISETAAIARAWQDAALARQLHEDVQRNSNSMESSARGRVLICAQSNAAVDELVSRISSQGLYGSDGKMYKPYLVRVGNVKTVHPNSLPFFIDTLVDQRLVEERMNVCNEKNDLSVESSMALRSNLEKLVDRIRFYEAKRANLRDGNVDLKNSLEDGTHKGDDGKEMSDAEIESQLRKLYEQKKQIYKDLSNVQSQEKKANEETRALRYKLRKSILREAEIVVTTLSGCGGDLYGVCSESMSNIKFGSPSERTLFDAVVIDEAAQALEPATLIPLQLLKSSGTKCIMVGDPKQLPATVLSSVASKFLYECSMFERLQRAGHPVIMLTEQYRMHPEICRFPSLHFYDRKLLNGDKMSSKSAPFHEIEGLGPYVFYDIVDGQEHRGKNSGALSLYNEHEADAAVEVLRFFKKRYPSEFVGGRIGIITPYKSQLSLLRSRFSSSFGSSVIDDMEFNTVDGFQGREVDILILSTVRAGDPSTSALGINSSSIGFVADVRRMNVALTRAKLSLWILGNARTLQTNHNWAALIKNAKERNLVISVKTPYKSMFKTDFCKNAAPRISDKHSRQHKHVEKAKDVSQHAKQNESIAKQTIERKMKYVGCADHSQKRGIGDEKDFLAIRENIPSTGRSARDECKFPVKTDSSSSVTNGSNRTSEDVKCAISGKQVTDGERKGKESSENKVSLGNTHISKRKDKFENYRSNLDHSVRESGDSQNLLKSQVSKRLKKSSDGDRSQKNQEVAIPLPESNLKERDANDGDKVPSQTGTAEDLIAKRKKQRDAVDAILYSSLISSKKSETSMKPLPAKRPFSSSSNVSGGIKPSKTRKVPSASSTSASRDQIRQHRRTGKESLGWLGAPTVR